MQNTNQSIKPPHNYFIFPGLRELLTGTAVLTGIEFIAGTSAVSSLPLQSIFLATSAFLVLEVILFLLIYWSFEHNKGWLGFFIISGAFLFGAYVIGVLFTPLAVDFPKGEEVPNWLLELTVLLLAYVIFTIWKTILGIGAIYGWFTLLGSGLLLAHIYTKHGKAIEEKLNQL